MMDPQLDAECRHVPSQRFRDQHAERRARIKWCGMLARSKYMYVLIDRHASRCIRCFFVQEHRDSRVVNTV